MLEDTFLFRLLLATLVLTAGSLDIRSRRIPNWITALGIILGMAVNTLLPGRLGLWASLVGFGLAFGVYLGLYLLRAMGAGDVKLMAAVGAFVGPMDWLFIFAVTALLGGIFALILVIFKGRVRRTTTNLRFMLASLLSFRAPYMKHEELDVRNPDATRMPHGAVIALGTLVYLALVTITRAAIPGIG